MARPARSVARSSLASSHMINATLIERYRCPDHFAQVTLSGELSPYAGYFRFGEDTICYGQVASGSLGNLGTDDLWDAAATTTTEGAALRLPFEPEQIIDNLRFERYVANSHGRERGLDARSAVRSAYYIVRPMLPVQVRKHLQRWHLAGWETIPFPRWPVDRTVEHIFERQLASLLRSGSVESIPFIWFWPHGLPSCAIVTHDVETAVGRDFCRRLMDIDESVAVKSSFQIVPESRYAVTARFLDDIRERGFEVNVHDLNHDGQLFRDRDEFLRRAERINRYRKDFRADGFRSAVLYRNLEWYDALDFAYDMSVPNVAHLDPQRGGCCTVMPYFIGEILELPLTTTQDYSRFHVLNEYSIELWKRQVALVTERHGLVSFNIHPDYVRETRAQHAYQALLDYLTGLRSKKKIWMALPGEVNQWWRERSQMRLIGRGNGWNIEGPGKERARVARAQLEGDRVVYRLEAACPTTSDGDTDSLEA